VGSDLGGIPELIIPNETGLLATAGDVASYADQLSAMNLKSHAELSEMGRAGREFVEARFTQDHHVEGLFEIYRELGVT
jgi:glycosyltransferase involved in cell wall biosynthesis